MLEGNNCGDRFSVAVELLGHYLPLYIKVIKMFIGEEPLFIIVENMKNEFDRKMQEWLHEQKCLKCLLSLEQEDNIWKYLRHAVAVLNHCSLRREGVQHNQSYKLLLM